VAIADLVCGVPLNHADDSVGPVPIMCLTKARRFADTENAQEGDPHVQL